MFDFNLCNLIESILIVILTPVHQVSTINFHQIINISAVIHIGLKMVIELSQKHAKSNINSDIVIYKTCLYNVPTTCPIKDGHRYTCINTKTIPKLVRNYLKFQIQISPSANGMHIPLNSHF